ncbi:hypothetical protein KIK06_12620 [Nocardiopsis sp. EMB25]|uniref:hypothetical protein n=1 Tax=Nocardiopsis sp. EMB25 TaxID=2835867 RepID=UPI002284530C|nr:hypothetical protein [Nocardiopsis sp. EMB25]MCY9784735.1 hypothetical protein [Nocardiopsis sp. EMB25]
MSVFTALSAGGLSALLMAPVPGADTLHVVVEAAVEAEPLREGDRVDLTIRIRNSGGEALPEAQVVQFVSPAMEVTSTSPEAAVEDGRIVWTGALEAGERAVLTAVGEITDVPDEDRSVTTVCVRPAPDATLASCASAVHIVRGPVIAPWVIGGAALTALLTAGAIGLHRRLRRPASAAERETGTEAAAEADQGTGAEPKGTADPTPANVYHLDSRR